ncbi:MAG: hypothetical protein KKB20_30400, partial [Proteobacteria bacterium]|nr:hypothetical protein [Pseudomonadota bacterium]
MAIATFKNLLATLIISSLLAAGCGEVDEDLCGAAASHLGSCFGPTAARSFAETTCDPASAERLLQMSCMTLGQATSGGKMDELGLDDAIQEAIRKAVREKVVEALKAVLSQLLGSLGGMMDQYDFYLLLDKSSSKVLAESQASQLAAMLASVPALRPTVVQMDDGWGVVQGACPISLTSDLPERIADMVEGNPGLIKALGGSIVTAPGGSTACAPPSAPDCADPDDPTCAAP